MELVKKENQQSAMTAFKAVLNAESVQAQFANALGKHKDAFVASMIDLYGGDKSLQQCKPAQVVAEALEAATLQLPLNKSLGFSYIVVYNNSVKNPDGSFSKVPTPTFIPGYRGYIQLAMRTGQYRTINADVVYEGEFRSLNKLTGEVAFDGEKKSDKVAGYFCYFELLNGFSKTLFMSVEQMAKYAKKYAPNIPRTTTIEQLIELANKEGGKKVGWEGNFNDMAIKTVIRKLLSKYGYLSVEMQQAMANDIERSQEQEEETANSKVLNIDKIQDAEVETEDKKEEKDGEEDNPGY
jgi:recombination protein RecT